MFAHRAFLCVAVLLGVLAAPALANGSFVKIGNIQGEAVEAQHQGWIQIGTWGMETKGGGFSILSFKSEAPTRTFWFEKRVDPSSGALHQALGQRTQYQRVVFDMAVGNDIFRTILFDVRVVAVETHAKSERVTLQFQRQAEQHLQLTEPKS